MEPSKKFVLLLLTTILASAIVFGGLGYYLGTLQNENKTQITTASSSSPSSLDKQYTNSKYNLSFTYPVTWTLIEGKAPRGEDTMITLNDIDSTESDLTVTINEYNDPSGLQRPAYAPEDLEAWLKQPGQNYKSIETVTIGGRSGFVAEPQDSVTPGKIYYIPQKDKSIISIWDTGLNGITKNILNSFIFVQ